MRCHQVIQNTQITPEIMHTMNQLLKEISRDALSLTITDVDEKKIHINFHATVAGPYNKGLLKKSNKLLIERVISLYEREVGFRNRMFDDRYDGKIKKLAGEVEQYYIRIKNFPKKAFFNESKNSLYTAFLKFKQHYLEDNDIDDESCMIHEDVVEDLIKNHLIGVRTKYERKPHGFMTGLVFWSYENKKVFVKVSNSTECLDFAVFKIAKACGVRTPVVDVVITEKNVYHFSKDVNDPSSLHFYSDLKKYKWDENCYFDVNAMTLFSGRRKNGSFDNDYAVDKINQARLILAAVIFGWRDLQTVNMGIVISHKTDTPKAKFAVVDFMLRTKLISEMTNTSLKDFLLNQSVIYKKDLLFKIASELTEKDYVLAFEKFSDNFERAHLDVYRDVKKVLLKLADKLGHDQVTQLENNYNIWASNFKKIENLVKDAKKNLSSSTNSKQAFGAW